VTVHLIYGIIMSIVNIKVNSPRKLGKVSFFASLRRKDKQPPRRSTTERIKRTKRFTSPRKMSVIIAWQMPLIQV
jgi:hypothetical protein